MNQTSQVHTLQRPQRVHVVSIIVRATALELAGLFATYAGAQHIVDEVHVLVRARETVTSTPPFQSHVSNTGQITELSGDQDEEVYTVVVDTTLTDVSMVRQIQDAVNSGPAIPLTEIACRKLQGLAPGS
jgi:hypothetical protein